MSLLTISACQLNGRFFCFVNPFDIVTIRAPKVPKPLPVMDFDELHFVFLALLVSHMQLSCFWKRKGEAAVRVSATPNESSTFF